MSHINSLIVHIALIAIGCTFASTQVHAVQRAHVSALVGLDSNVSFNCDVVHPCRFFQAAMTVVDPNGEVVALDSGGYGAVTITQSIALIAPAGVYAGISVFAGGTGNGVTIATPNVNVILRGLTINGQGGTAGIAMTAGKSLSVEECTIANFPSDSGISVNAAAKIRISDTLLRNNRYGMLLQGGSKTTVTKVKIYDSLDFGILVRNIVTAAPPTTVTVADSVLAGNDTGILAYTSVATAYVRASIIRTVVNDGVTGLNVASTAGGIAQLILSESTVTGHTSAGLTILGTGAVLESLGNNTVRQNEAAVVGLGVTSVPLI